MKNDTQIKNVELIKRLVGEYVNNSRYARFIEFVESDDSEKNSYLEVIFDCGGYFATLTYKYFAHTEGNIYLTIAFNGCRYRFTLYDIFNLLDIDDFNLYSFNNCIEEKGIAKAFDAVNSAIEKYTVDIRKCNTPANIAKLMKNRVHDVDVLCSYDADDDDYINGNFDYVRKYSKLSKQKAIDLLNSKKNCGNITIYESRLLNYLNLGNDIQSKTKGLEFKKARVIVYSAISPFAIAFGIALYFFIEWYLFGDNIEKTYPSGLYDRFFLPDYILNIILSILLIFFALVRFLGRPIVKKITFEKEIARTKFEEKSGFRGIIGKVFVPVISLVLAIVVSFVANTDCVVFGEDSIIVPPPNGFSEKYDNINVYLLDHFSDDSNGQVYFSTDSTAYIIEHNGKFYDVPIMNTGEIEERQFTAQLKEHNITVTKVNTANDIKGYNES